MSLHLTTPQVVARVNPSAPRTIITTDPELDDLNSMLRLLLYSNEINIVGLVYSASQFHYIGDPATGVAPHRWPAAGEQLHIDDAIDAYAQVWENLVVHDPRYPSPDHLRSLVAVGNIANVGEMDADTPGSDLIKAVLLDDEPGQVFLQTWGGFNTTARALRSIENELCGTDEWPVIHAKVTAKTVITAFGQQDSTFAEYIRPVWPGIELREVSTFVWGYFARMVAREEDQEFLSTQWTRENITDVGPIGTVYRVWGDGKQMAEGFDEEDYFGITGRTANELTAMGYRVWCPLQEPGSFLSEGDSSNFALLIDNGLRSWEHPGWGGWGGRQTVSVDDPALSANKLSHDADESGATPKDYSAARCLSAFQRDFAARLRWSVTDTYGAANHAPELAIDQGLEVTAAAGETVRLSARATDPDGDDVVISWWVYAEAGTCPSPTSLVVPAETPARGADMVSTHSTIGVVVPSDAEPGQTIHVICQADDDGVPSLTTYQRVVVKVA